jgi:hypothetical protein
MSKTPTGSRSEGPPDRLELAADAVVAAYIHKISDRHRSVEPEARERVRATAERTGDAR